ncbi:glycosyltransferase [Microbacterium sp. NIBRBAC000506063]|uniref:glycosyltransferase n=1 Tax=Microbacterium sp. NIBRBAC000506063 TaxID=2734618 RepID=UPI001CB6C38B|nr:glycosyltransferase [Microbacterium sp. NIBRBAC000506063]
MAPLVKHDRLHDNDQTVATIWDLRAWERPEALPKSTVAWQRGMLRRAVRHADAVVVPSHAMAARLGALAGLGDRIRVIAGAPPERLSVPSDAARRRADLFLPAEYVVLSGDEADLAGASAPPPPAGCTPSRSTLPKGRAAAGGARGVGRPGRAPRARARDLELGDRAAVLAGAGRSWRRAWMRCGPGGSWRR